MPRPAALSALLATLLLTGCARDERPARPQDGMVVIEIRDFRYKPQTVRARHGIVAFRVTNHGRLPHNFNVRGPRAVRLEGSSLLPGETAQPGVRLRRGEYRMFCSIGNHEELGEYGTLVVR